MAPATEEDAAAAPVTADSAVDNASEELSEGAGEAKAAMNAADEATEGALAIASERVTLMNKKFLFTHDGVQAGANLEGSHAHIEDGRGVSQAWNRNDMVHHVPHEECVHERRDEHAAIECVISLRRRPLLTKPMRQASDEFAPIVHEVHLHGKHSGSWYPRLAADEVRDVDIVCSLVPKVEVEPEFPVHAVGVHGIVVVILLRELDNVHAWVCGGHGNEVLIALKCSIEPLVYALAQLEPPAVQRTNVPDDEAGVVFEAFRAVEVLVRESEFDERGAVIALSLEAHDSVVEAALERSHAAHANSKHCRDKVLRPAVTRQ